jgi:hypothetical protein
MVSYLAGFIDSDGTITAQIKHRKTGFFFALVCTITLHQKVRRAQWFFPLVKQHLNGYGTIYDKGNGKMELVISNPQEVKTILLLLYPYLRLKRRQAKYALDILNKYPNVRTHKEFYNLCKVADRLCSFNDSKNRTITSQTVLDLYQSKNLL